MRGLRVLTVLVLLCGATACTSVVVPPPPVTVAPTSAPGAVTLPPRPRDIPIDEVDPCSLLTPAQQAELGLDGEPDRSTDSNDLLGSTRNCTQLKFTSPRFAIDIALATQAGVERYTIGETSNRISVIDIAGYPAILARPRADRRFCTVALDVAPGQLVDVQFMGIGSEQAITSMDDLCAGARRVADDIMQTLLNR